MSQVLADNTHEIADNLAKLGDLVEELQQVVGSSGMPLDDCAVLQLAKADHLLWVQRLHNLFWGREELTPKEVTSDHECRFGHWYYGDAKSTFASQAAFQRLEVPHARIHELAQEIVQTWHAGQREEAHQLFAELQQVSSQLISLIEEMEEAARCEKNQQQERPFQ